MLDTRETCSLSDFVSNPEAHFARLKETHTPQVLTVNGQAEAVLLDTETYEDLMEQIRRVKGAVCHSCCDPRSQMRWAARGDF